MGNRFSVRSAKFYGSLQTILLVAVVLLASETLLVLGIVTPVAIHGSSMAPALLGPHLKARCPHCGWGFAVGVAPLPQGRPIVCPDCKSAFNNTTPRAIVPGERVWVNRLAAPHRWDAVVFRCPERATTYCIKRVLALPGEHVDFQRGDLVVNGRVVQKSLYQQYRLRQLVHRERSDYLQWISMDDGWHWSDGAWRAAGDPAVLTYVPAKGLAVTDDLGINQAAMRRTNVALDLMVSCSIELRNGGRVEMLAEFADGSQFVSPQITQAGDDIVWSLFDRQAMLAIDRDAIWARQHAGPWPGPPELILRATGDVTVRDLCVYRDAYYHTRPVDRWPASGVPLAGDEWFMVGDNVAISKDSRTWARRGLPRDLVVGVPIGVK
jgi:signal peptidase I